MERKGLKPKSQAAHEEATRFGLFVPPSRAGNKPSRAVPFGLTLCLKPLNKSFVFSFLENGESFQLISLGFRSRCDLGGRAAEKIGKKRLEFERLRI